MLEDPNFHFHYDCEGNLVFKEFKKTRGYSSLGREAIEKKHGIKFKATATGWLYEWSGNGMLERVINPQQGKIRFGYDPLGRRVWKEVKNTRTCWLWDGNVPLHEWTETKDEPQVDIITWVFEEGGFVPCARLTENGSQSIVTDYLGTPSQMYDSEGNKTWHAELDIYGRIRTFAGSSLRECPFRYQGQYEDNETGLYYNRFRYYDPSSGVYLSQDPIRFYGGSRFYAYVHNPNIWIDVFGLAGTGGAYMFGFESGDMYIGKGEKPRMGGSVSTRSKQVGNSPLAGKAHVGTGGNNELGKMVEYKAMKDAGFKPGGKAGVPNGYLNSHMSGKSTWDANPHLQGKATELANKLRADYEADVKSRQKVKGHHH